MPDEYSKQRRLFEEDRGGFAFREVFTPDREGPLPPRPHRSGKGGPSVGQPWQQTGSVWSASDAAANGMTLSNGGLTVTPSDTGHWETIRTSISKTSGKLYVEFYCSGGAPVATNQMFGLANASFSMAGNTYLGSSNYSGGVQPSSGTVVVSSGFTSNYTATVGPAALSDVWALAVDFTTGSVWVARNNVWVNGSNPATGSLPILSFVYATVGALFAAQSLLHADSVWTLQATAASQKYLPPPGFQAWDGGPVTPSTSVWSASDAAANGMTLSNGGLTVTAGPSSSWQTVRGTISHTTGKFYIEFLINTVGAAVVDGLGISSAFIAVGTGLGQANYSLGFYTASIGTFASPSSDFTNHLAISAGASAGDVWSIAIDLTAGNVWVAQNNVWTTGNPATAASPNETFVAPSLGQAYSAALSLQQSAVWTLQATAASQKYAPPAGFSAWG